MRSITLAQTPIETSVLGFGCSALMGTKTRQDGIELLEAAYDAGIRYYDVAPAYGYGEAEGLVGEFSRGRRDKLVLASKFGVQPLASLSRMGSIRSIARKLMRLSPGLRNMIGRGARTMMKRDQFHVEQARQNLETSLRRLQTDYIDVYLLHDCSPGDVSPELHEFLARAREAGKIRAFGIGTTVSSATAIRAEHPEFTGSCSFRIACSSEISPLWRLPGQ